MANGQQAVVLRQVQRLFGLGTVAGMAERQILERFITLHDEAAFEAIVALHGPMVLGVCRRLLNDPNDVEDAFQATFLVLVRKAGQLRDRNLLGPWLHGVARRVAARAWAEAARRRARERQGEGLDIATGSRVDDQRDLRDAIDQEVGRLPEKLRSPVILCHLEGRSYEEAARQLQWTTGMVRGRLARARERLRERLLRRGIHPTIILPLTQGGFPVDPLAVPADLVASTLGATASGAASTTVTILAVSALRSLYMGRLRGMGFALLSVLIVGVSASAGLLIVRPPARLAMAAAPPPAAKAKEVEKPAQASSERAGPRPGPGGKGEIHPITIVGQARDEAGRPLPSATIQVVDCNDHEPSDTEEVLGRTTSGADGRFVLRAVPLPVLAAPPGPIAGPREGRFEVSGWVTGRSFNWHEIQRYRPEPRPANAKAEDAGRVFYQGETVESNLTFGLPARLHGQITEDRGRPVAGARVQVGYGTNPRSQDGSGWSNCAAIIPRAVGDEPQFKGIQFVPEAFRSARSDANGHYVIEGLPRETTLLAQIDYQPEYQAQSLTIATTTEATSRGERLGHDGVLNHRFITPRTVRIRVTQADTGRPAQGVTITAEGARIQYDGARTQTDADGNATLRLFPGTYTLQAEPRPGAAYVLTEEPLTVAEKAPEQSATLALTPGAVVVFEAVDEKSSAEIAGIRAVYETDTTRERKAVPSQTVFGDHPATGRDGRFQAVMAAGNRRFYPVVPHDGYQPVTTESPLLTLKAGETTKVRFVLRNEPARHFEPQPPGDETGRRLEERWRSQRTLAMRGRMQAKRFSISDFPMPSNPRPRAFLASIPADRLRTLLDSLDPDRVPELPELIAKTFPDAPPPTVQNLEIVMDGPCRREVEYRLRRGGEKILDFLTVTHGEESIRYRVSHGPGFLTGEVTLFGRGMFKASGFAEFCEWPTFAGRLVGRDKNRVILEQQYGTRSRRITADEASGFIYRSALLHDDARLDMQHWQFAPRTTPEGLTIPGLSVELMLDEGKVTDIQIKVIESIDLAAPFAPETFTVSVPAGVSMTDQQTLGERTYRGMTLAPVTDIRARIKRIDETIGPFAAKVKTGTLAPAIEAAAWLNRDGRPSKPPALKGKVVVIDFWGMTCAPCVAELHELREAVELFDGTDLIIIGLHDSEGTVEQVADFAAQRGLRYPIAIDRPAKEPGWFGETFATYGVREIPSAAVIDRDGKIAFVGSFLQALKAASGLRKKRGN